MSSVSLLGMIANKSLENKGNHYFSSTINPSKENLYTPKTMRESLVLILKLIKITQGILASKSSHFSTPRF